MCIFPKREGFTRGESCTSDISTSVFKAVKLCSSSPSIVLCFRKLGVLVFGALGKPSGADSPIAVGGQEALSDKVHEKGLSKKVEREELSNIRWSAHSFRYHPDFSSEHHFYVR